VPLEVRDVAPCEDCGADPSEIEHFRDGLHTFSEYEVLPGLTLVLCNFCDVDFGSYDPGFFGLPPESRVGYGSLRHIRSLEAPALAKDKYCPSCKKRLAFLRFVQRARELNAIGVSGGRADG
jgi:hypothetical protein